MNNFTALVLDISGIQKYIFNSNTLKHIIGASGLIYEATHDWVYSELVKIGPSNIDSNGIIDDKAKIEDGELTTELIFTGGGNTVILFRDKIIAHHFVKNLTRKAIQDAPGLEICVAKEEFNWDDPSRSLRVVVQDILDAVNERKRHRRKSMPLLGLGVTADCQITGLPAVTLKHGDRISAEIFAKLNAADRAQARLQNLVPTEYRDDLEFLSDFNDVGDKGQSSYIAVVHIDGNSMGQRVLAVTQDSKNNDNREYIRTIRNFSNDIRNAAIDSLQHVILTLLQSRKDGKIGGVVSIRGNRLPFRPIIFGGDDFTFVCDGRLGLTITAHYLDQFSNKKLTYGGALSGRAGIAVVKSHFPFAQAYQVAEGLAASAREFITERDQGAIKTTNAIDWHFTPTGPIQRIAEIRTEQYQVPSGCLTMRPIQVGGSGDWRSWENFTAMLNAISNPLGDWGKRKNKLIALREVLRQGPVQVEHYRTLFSLPNLPPILGNEQASSMTGWIGDRCTVFDPIEAIDFFVPLEGKADV